MDDAATFCPHCGYDLRSLTTDACPECGGEVDLAALQCSRIPWIDRHSRGRLRAFWGTVWQSTFHTERMAHAMARPVDYADARRFQAALVIWLMAWLVLAAGAATLLTWIGGERLWLIPIYALTLLMAALFLFAATGAASYWFHPGTLPIERQNRAVALSYYVHAPLAFLPAAAVVLLVGLLVIAIADDQRLPPWWYAGIVTTLAGVVLLAVIPYGWWRRCLAMASDTTQRQGSGLVLMAVGLPLSWLGLAALCFVLIPGSIAWLWLVGYTLLG